MSAMPEPILHVLTYGGGHATLLLFNNGRSSCEVPVLSHTFGERMEGVRIEQVCLDVRNTVYGL
jgi:hypothetical protein